MGYEKDENMLLEAAAAGDDSAVEALFRRYLPMMYGVALRYGLKPERLVAGDNPFRDHFNSGIPTAVGHTVGEKVFGLMVSFLVGEGLMSIDDAVAASDSPDRLITDRLESDPAALSALLESRGDNLTKPQRECLELFFGARLTFSEIAERTGYLTGKIPDYIIEAIRLLEKNAGR